MKGVWWAVLLGIIATGLSIAGLMILHNEQRTEEFIPKTKGGSTLILTVLNYTTVEHHSSGETAFAILNKHHSLKTGGKLCVDGICDNREFHWTFYINDKYGVVQPQKYAVKPNDTIEFVYK